MLIQIPASENNLSENTEDEGAVLAKLARCGYFEFLKLNQFKTSFVSVFKLSVAKNPFISALISSLIQFCCSSFCVVVFESFLNKEYKVENLYGSKFTEGCGFGLFCGNIGESPS